MPATLGWHPWFVRRLAGADPDVELRFEADWMYERDPAGLPNGRLVTPERGPWDDCFVGVHSPPRLTWPNHLALELRSTADHWVVYSELAHAVCVEPQTGPPDDVNLGRSGIVERGDTLAVEMSWTWWSPGESAPGEMPALVADGQPDERATGQRVGVGAPLAGQVPQYTNPVAARGGSAADATSAPKSMSGARESRNQRRLPRSTTSRSSGASDRGPRGRTG